jgi:hypothetical protein
MTKGPAHSVPGLLSFGGAEGIRTPGLLIANETRYQLRHSPECGRNDNTSATPLRNRAVAARGVAAARGSTQVTRPVPAGRAAGGVGASP